MEMRNDTPRRTGLTYEERAWESAWKGRARGLWTGIAMGVVIGGAIGALAALSTMLVGVPVAGALGLMLPMAKVFALTGLGMGMLTGTECGAISGAVAGAMRMQGSKTEAAGQNQAALKKKLFNGKVALVGILGGLAVGALIASGGGVAAIAAAAGGLGVAAHAAAVCITMAGCALMGSIFGINLPMISRKLSSRMGGVLSGDAFEQKATPIAQQEVAGETPVLSGKIRAILDGSRSGSFSERIASRPAVAFAR